MGQSGRRKFGRRRTHVTAWIFVDGHRRLSCIVRGLTSRGALLELDVPDWLPFAFQLVLDDPEVIFDCETRHSGTFGVGVLFADQAKTLEQSQEITMHDAHDWIANSVPSCRWRN